jgi:hypothetical protein
VSWDAGGAGQTLGLEEKEQLGIALQGLQTTLVASNLSPLQVLTRDCRGSSSISYDAITDQQSWIRQRDQSGLYHSNGHHVKGAAAGAAGSELTGETELENQGQILEKKKYF